MRVHTLFATLLATSAFAVPIETEMSMRLLDSTGAPEQGQVTVDVSLWTSATSTDGADQLWTTQLTPTATDGYANLVLSGLDSDWFASDVWVDLVVDGNPMDPRMKIRDVPGAVGGGTAGGTSGGITFAEYTLGVGNWFPTGVVYRGGSYTEDLGSGQMQFNGWTEYLPNLVTFPLLSSGQVSAGTPISVEADMAYTCVVADCDVGLRVQDGAGTSCALLPGDAGQLWRYHSGWTSESNVGTGSSTGTRNVSIAIHAVGGEQTTMELVATSGHTSQSTTCPRGLDVSTGLTAFLTGGHTTESYAFGSLAVRATDPRPASTTTEAEAHGRNHVVLSGPDMMANPDVQLLAGGAAWDNAAARTVFSGWSTDNTPLFTADLAPAGQIPADTPVRVRVEADYTCSGDCDPGFRVEDGNNNWCVALPGDSDTFFVGDHTSALTNIGWPRASSNEKIVIDFYPYGAGHPTLVSAYSQRPDAGIQPRWVCPASLEPETGLRMVFVGNNITETYNVHAINVELTW